LAYEESVKKMKVEHSRLMVKAHTKKELQQKYSWDGTDTTYADSIIKCCKEILFPRFKFLHGNWMEYSEGRRSLSRLVLANCPIPELADPEDAWDCVITPTIAMKYADMLFNINNATRSAFVSK
jgi:hypothetical protein